MVGGRQIARLPAGYKDYGSLVSLSYNSVGNLMGNLLGSVMVEGRIARLTYQSLYKQHQLALPGLGRAGHPDQCQPGLRTESRLKLH